MMAGVDDHESQQTSSGMHKSMLLLPRPVQHDSGLAFQAGHVARSSDALKGAVCAPPVARLQEVPCYHSFC